MRGTGAPARCIPGGGGKHCVLNVRRAVIILSHIAMHPPATQPSTLLWHFEEVRSARVCVCVCWWLVDRAPATQVSELIQRFAGDVVVAVFSGHDHTGGYAVDDGWGWAGRRRVR